MSCLFCTQMHKAMAEVDTAAEVHVEDVDVGDDFCLHVLA